MSIDVNDYIENGGSSCPWCRSLDITVTGRPEVCGTTIYQEVECEGCGCSWKDVYVLDNIEDFTPPPEEEDNISTDKPSNTRVKEL